MDLAKSKPKQQNKQQRPIKTGGNNDTKTRILGINRNVYNVTSDDTEKYSKILMTENYAKQKQFS